MIESIQIISKDNIKIVEINNIKFSGKRRINWDAVEQYLKQYVGKSYEIEETGDIVYIGPDFPDEYAHSRYSAKAFGTIGKAKANASQAIPELIKIAANLTYSPNMDKKHESDAPNGWYRTTVRFTVPISDDKGCIIGRNYYRARMIIRCSADRKLFLYDIIDIKKET